MDTGARQPSKTFSTRMTGSPASADARLYLITRKLGKRDRPPPCFLPPVPLRYFRVAGRPHAFPAPRVEARPLAAHRSGVKGTRSRVNRAAGRRRDL